MQVNTFMPTYKWAKVSDRDDRINKQDWTTQNGLGRRINAQFKSRITGNDILVCVKQPFYGFSDPRTQPGRDIVGTDISYYVTYPPLGDNILVSKANDVKETCAALEEELLERDGDLPFYSRKFTDPYDPYKPTRPACCQLRFTTDKGDGYRKGVPKLLAFLPPHLVPHRKLPVSPADFLAYMTEKMTKRQSIFEF